MHLLLLFYVYKCGKPFRPWLVIVLVHCRLKRRSLFEDSAFVCIGYEWFRFLLSYVKHGKVFEIQRI
ncbi:hypothetical protein BK735_10045 [Bacillus mycoides]|nr:hypothetical protein BK735_10045 [Bacillus mycoides]PRD07394.1 transposase [Bacillus sp. MYb56]QWI25302.1 transposase [Bacillus mycoides]